MKRLAFRHALTATVLVAVVYATAASAARVQVGSLPVSIVLPAGWTATGASGTVRFGARASSGYGLLQVTAGGSFPMSLPYATFVQTEISSARSAYRAQDPRASVTGKKVVFPPGPCVEINVVVQHGVGQVLGIELFSFLHAGVTYHFTYVTNQAGFSAMRKSFEASARTITFKK